MKKWICIGLLVSLSLYIAMPEVQAQEGVPSYPKIETPEESESLTPSFATLPSDEVHVFKGQVVDEQNNPIVGVVFYQARQNNGTTSDEKGYFQMYITTLAPIRISCLGYETQMVVPTPNLSTSIVMYSSAIALNEVVAMAYANTTVKSNTGALSTLKAKKGNLGGTTSTVDQLITGRLAGVTVRNISAQPGGAAQIYIRGRSSMFLDTRPLYVIDGFVMNQSTSRVNGSTLYSNGMNPLNILNPNDIESITVLKDAAATAIYGTQGANGVVMITTKIGHTEKLVTFYSGSYSIQTPASSYSLMNSKEYMNFYNDKGLSTFSPTQKSNSTSTNWLSKIQQLGQIQNHYLSFQGATNYAKYYTSFSYYGSDGILQNTGLDRFSGMSKLMFDVEHFHVKTTIMASHLKEENELMGDNSSNSVIKAAIRYAPYLEAKDEEGNYTTDPLNSQLDNPMALLAIQDQTQTDQVNLCTSISYDMGTYITPEVKLSYDVSNSQRRFYVPSYVPYLGNSDHNGTGAQNSEQLTGLLLNALFHTHYDYHDHHFKGVLGYEYHYRERSNTDAYNSNFQTDETTVDNLGGGTNPQNYSTRNSRVDGSHLLRLDYDYKEKYLAMFSLRRDGSSVFGQNYKIAYFPGLSFGWRPEKEDFMQAIDPQHILQKVRLGWGVSGNSGISPYQSISLYETNSDAVIGGNSVVGEQLTTFKASPDLKWERTSQFNIGLDFNYHSRLWGSLDSYYKHTEDLIVLLMQSPMTGHGTQWQNAASLNNWGVELTLNSKNITTKHWLWTSALTFAWNDNAVDSYNFNNIGGQAALRALGIVEGERINSYYSYIVDGVDPETGSFSYKDRDNNGTISFNDKALIGTPDPRVTIGLNNTVSYKNWTLSFFFNSNFGNKLFNMTAAENSLYDGASARNYFSSTANYWSENYPTSTMPSNDQGDGSPYFNSKWIEDAWFIRLQDLTISYDLENFGFLQSTIKKGSIYVQAQNLFLITPYSGLDPELTNTSYVKPYDYYPGFLAGSFDAYAYPPARTFSIGIKLFL